MTHDLTELRKLVAEMSPGEWAQHSHHVVVWGKDGGNIASCGDPLGTTEAGRYTDPGLGDPCLEIAYANARAIVAAVRLLRAVVEPDEATVGAVAGLIDPGAWEVARKSRAHWQEPARRSARAVLTTLAALALPGEGE